MAPCFSRLPIHFVFNNCNHLVTRELIHDSFVFRVWSELFGNFNLQFQGQVVRTTHAGTCPQCYPGAYTVAINSKVGFIAWLDSFPEKPIPEGLLNHAKNQSERARFCAEFAWQLARLVALDPETPTIPGADVLGHEEAAFARNREGYQRLAFAVCRVLGGTWAGLLTERLAHVIESDEGAISVGMEPKFTHLELERLLLTVELAGEQQEEEGEKTGLMMSLELRDEYLRDQWRHLWVTDADVFAPLLESSSEHDVDFDKDAIVEAFLELECPRVEDEEWISKEVGDKWLRWGWELQPRDRRSVIQFQHHVQRYGQAATERFASLSEAVHEIRTHDNLDDIKRLLLEFRRAANLQQEATLAYFRMVVNFCKEQLAADIRNVS